MRLAMLALAAASLTGCGSEPKPAAPAAAKELVVQKPADESRHFPLADRTGTEVVDNHLLGKSFMPGGTLAHYRHGKTEYTMFVAKLGTAQDAAFLLLDWNKTLAGSTLVPSFGGYFGQDGGQPVFVFTKNAWIAGVAGLAQKEADAAARTLAAHLD